MTQKIEFMVFHINEYFVNNDNFFGINVNGNDLKFSGRLLKYIATKKGVSGYFITFEENHKNLLHKFVLKLVIDEHNYLIPPSIIRHDLD